MSSAPGNSRVFLVPSSLFTSVLSPTALRASLSPTWQHGSTSDSQWPPGCRLVAKAQLCPLFQMPFPKRTLDFSKFGLLHIILSLLLLFACNSHLKTCLSPTSHSTDLQNSTNFVPEMSLAFMHLFSPVARLLGCRSSLDPNWSPHLCPSPSALTPARLSSQKHSFIPTCSQPPKPP